MPTDWERLCSNGRDHKPHTWFELVDGTAHFCPGVNHA